jgi:tetratricopeptide (TPR) repeat protein
MRASWRVSVLAGVLLLASLLSSILLLRRVDNIRSGSTLEEVLYVSSPRLLKRMSLGYNGLLANIYWTRAVQYFGNKHHEGARRYDLLAPLLEITTELDPNLLVAYEYGANFLSPKPPNGAGMPSRAIDLEEFGIRHNPDSWRLYYNQGFIYYTELKDYARAADAFARGSKTPNAHPFLAVMAAKMAEHAGDLQMARMMWSTTYESSQDKAVKANAGAHLRALQVDEDVSILEKLVSSYKRQTGRLPASFSDLMSAGLLRGVPLDPFGHPYKISADGRVEVRQPDNFPFIEKGTPPGYVAPAMPKLLPTD